jgi:hypothetical protein
VPEPVCAYEVGADATAIRPLTSTASRFLERMVFMMLSLIKPLGFDERWLRRPMFNNPD